MFGAKFGGIQFIVDTVQLYKAAREFLTVQTNSAPNQGFYIEALTALEEAVEKWERYFEE